MIQKKALAASIAAVLGAYAVSAEAQSGPRGGFFTDTASPAAAIPDAGYDGTLASMACSTIDASSITAGTSIDAVEIDTAIDHTWVGDLTIKLESPAGSVLGVMSRPGSADAADDGNTTQPAGNGDNIVATSPVTFIDGAAASAEDMGTTGVVCQDDGICSYAPAPDSVATPPSNFAGFGGEDPSGTWTLCVGDSQGLDTGTFQSWTLNVTYSGGGAPTVGLSAGSVGFGNVAVGSTSTPQTVTITNTGTADLTMGTLGISGADAGAFTLSNDTCSSAVVTPSATCSFDVSYTASAAGASTAQVDIPSDAASSPDSVALSGTGAVSVGVPTNTVWGIGLLGGLLALFGWLGIRSRG